MLGASDSTITRVLDFAASEVIEKKPAIGIGVFQQFITGMLGGRKALARVGQVAGAPATRGLFRGLGRLFPTVATEIQR